MSLDSWKHVSYQKTNLAAAKTTTTCCLRVTRPYDCTNRCWVYIKTLILSYFERKIKSVMRNRSSPFKSRHFALPLNPLPQIVYEAILIQNFLGAPRLKGETNITAQTCLHDKNFLSLSLSLCRNTSLVVNQAPCTLANHRLRSDKYSLILYGYQYFTPAVMTRDSCE